MCETINITCTRNFWMTDDHSGSGGVAAQRRASAVADSAVNRVAELIELYRLLLQLSDRFRCVRMRRDDFY